MSFWSARWSWSSNLGFVMLFECWFTMKSSFNILKTNIFQKILLTNARIILNIHWGWSPVYINPSKNSQLKLFWILGAPQCSWPKLSLSLYHYLKKKSDYSVAGGAISIRVTHSRITEPWSTTSIIYFSWRDCSQLKVMSKNANKIYKIRLRPKLSTGPGIWRPT